MLGSEKWFDLALKVLVLMLVSGFNNGDLASYLYLFKNLARTWPAGTLLRSWASFIYTSGESGQHWKSGLRIEVF